jgi:hypothetical protein
VKIAIIGGGWVGCHLANKLKDSHEIAIFEKNEELFLETSSKNQNRLHLGYHYARSQSTRELCSSTYLRFKRDYPDLVREVPQNIYCVPESGSLMDFNTYCKIFDIESRAVLPKEVRGIEGCVVTEESYIDFLRAGAFFNRELSTFVTTKHIGEHDILELQTVYDLVINATNNHLVILTSIEDFYYESTITLLYEKVQPTSFGALTLVDGKLFSIYPYTDTLYTVTHVSHTAIAQSKSVPASVLEIDCSDRVKLFEQSIHKYYPDFSKHFKYVDYYLATKVKTYSETDTRYPTISRRDNLVEVFTGKIQGIYIIEDYITNLISQYEQNRANKVI